MESGFLSLFLQALPAALAGCLLGYYVAIKEAPVDDRLRPSELASLLALGILGAALVGVLTQQLFGLLFPGIEIARLNAFFALVWAVALALYLAPRLAEHEWEITP